MGRQTQFVVLDKQDDYIFLLFLIEWFGFRCASTLFIILRQSFI